MEAVCAQLPLLLLGTGVRIGKSRALRDVGATVGQPTRMLHLIPLLGQREGAPHPCRGMLGYRQGQTTGKTISKAAAAPQRGGGPSPSQSVLCHSEAPGPSKMLTPAKPFAEEGLVEVSPPLPRSTFLMEPDDPPAVV